MSDIHFTGELDGTCRWWVESRGTRCGRDVLPGLAQRFCARHYKAAVRLLGSEKARGEEKSRRAGERLVERLPRLRGELAQVEAAAPRPHPLVAVPPAPETSGDAPPAVGSGRVGLERTPPGTPRGVRPESARCPTGVRADTQTDGDERAVVQG